MIVIVIGGEDETVLKTDPRLVAQQLGVGKCAYIQLPGVSEGRLLQEVLGALANIYWEIEDAQRAGPSSGDPGVGSG